MIYINPIPSQDEISETYQHYGENYFTQPEKLIVDFSASRYEREIRLLRKVNARGRLLDVGCSTGSFLLAAKDEGFEEAQGVEIAEPSVDYARRRGLEVHAGDFTQGLFPEGQYDVVTMWATLEHLAEPRNFVREAHRVLAYPGLLAVSVPNMRSLSQLILGTRDRYVGSDHLNYFVPTTLRCLLQTSGFRVIRTETHGINPLTIIGDLRGTSVSPISQINASVRTLEIKTARRFALLRRAHRIVDTALSWMGKGDLLLMVAQKTAAMSDGAPASQWDQGESRSSEM